MKSTTLIPTSIIIDYSHRTLLSNFIEFRKKLIDFYRLLSKVIDYRYYRMTTPGSTWLKLRNSKTQVNSSYFTFINKCHQHRCLNLMLQLVGITGHDRIKPHTL